MSTLYPHIEPYHSGMLQVCGGRMTPIAEITDKRVARKMLEHVGFPSDVPEPWPARGPPESLGSAWLDDEPRAPGDESTPAPDVE